MLSSVEPVLKLIDLCYLYLTIITFKFNIMNGMLAKRPGKVVNWGFST